jgi:hypothetical protein
VRPILGYGDACCDPYRDGQINALDRVQNKAAKFAHYKNDSVWEILAQRKEIGSICALSKRARENGLGRLKVIDYKGHAI